MNKKALTINPENGNKVLKTFVDDELNAKGKGDVAYSATAVDNIINSVNNSKADKNGNIYNDFSAKNITISGNIIPNKTGLSIGTNENRFSSIYVNEAYLSTNTLYLGDTPVMGTDSDTIMIKSDRDQSITMKTTGIGNSNIISEKGVELSTSGPNADVIVQAKGAGSRSVLSANNSVDIHAPYINMTGDANINGPLRTKSLTVDGNIVVNGETFVVNSTTVQTKDNIIEINYGQVGDGVSAGKAGLKVHRGDSAPYYMIFDESDDMFKVGTVESLQVLATRTYVDDNKYVHPAKHNVSEITGLSSVATSGNYSDLINKPELYNNWALKTNSGDTSQLSITNNKLININGDGGTKVSRSGDTITVSSNVYSAGNAINISDSVISHSNIVKNHTTSTQQATNGGTITAIDSITSNEQGHITAINTKTITLPTITNTWRGIQDNLTSTSTTESLSANQGKILKELIDTKANSSHGNHVPATQTANSKVFLRNDNTWQSLPFSSTSDSGIVQLSDSISSTSVSTAATSNAVKKSYDLANSKTQIIASQIQPSENIVGRVWIEITG